MRGSAMISDACAPNTSSSAPSSRVCLSFGCSKQAAGNDARYEAREEHGKIDCWHGQPSFIPAGFSFLSVLPPRCLRLVAGLRGGGRPRSPVGERDPGRDRTHPAYYEFNREPLSHSCSRFEPVAPICAPRLEARWLGVDDCAILSPCGRRAPSGESIPGALSACSLKSITTTDPAGSPCVLPAGFCFCERKRSPVAPEQRLKPF